MLAFVRITLKTLLICTLIAASPTMAKDIGRLKVGVIFPLSGSLASYGSDAVAGLKIAASQELSSNQTVRTEIDLLIRDSGSSAKVAADLAESLIKEHHVHALIGSLTSAATLAIAKVAQQHQRLHIVPISTASAITSIGPYIFRSCVTNGYQGRALAKFALDNLQKQRAAILLEEGFTHMEMVAAQFRRYFQSHGGTVMEQLTFNNKTSKAVLKKLAAQSPQVVLLPSSRQVAQRIITQARRLRMTATFLGIGDWHDKDSSTTPQQKHNHFFVSHFSPDDTQLAAAKFTTRFKLQNQREPSEFAAMSYDALALLIDAVQRAPLDPHLSLAQQPRGHTQLSRLGRQDFYRPPSQCYQACVCCWSRSLTTQDCPCLAVAEHQASGKRPRGDLPDAEVSQEACACSCGVSRSSRRSILPTLVLGNSSRNFNHLRHFVSGKAFAAEVDQFLLSEIVVFLDDEEFHRLA